MIGERIKQFRKANHLTQDDLASQLYVTRAAVSKWETGNGTPDLENINRLAALMGISIDTLLKEDGQRLCEKTSQEPTAIRETKAKTCRIVWSIMGTMFLVFAAGVLFLFPWRFTIGTRDIELLQIKEYEYSDSLETPDQTTKILSELKKSVRVLKKIDSEDPDVFPLCAVKIFYDQASVQWLEIYRAEEGFFFFDTKSGSTYQTSTELLEVLDACAYIWNPNHVSYLQGAATKPINISHNTVIPFTLTYSADRKIEGIRYRISTIENGQEAEWTEDSFVDAEQAFLQKGKIYSGISFSEGHMPYLNQIEHLESVKISFYEDNHSENLIGVLIIPAYELGDYPIAVEVLWENQTYQVQLIK